MINELLLEVEHYFPEGTSEEKILACVEKIISFMLVKGISKVELSNLIKGDK